MAETADPMILGSGSRLKTLRKDWHPQPLCHGDSGTPFPVGGEKNLCQGVRFTSLDPDILAWYGPESRL